MIEESVVNKRAEGTSRTSQTAVSQFIAYNLANVDI